MYKKKILFFTMTTGGGGAERVISNLCNNWPNEEEQIFVLTCIKSDLPYKLKDGINSYALIPAEDYWNKGKIKTFPAVCREYKKYIEKIRPDVIISFLPEPCIVASLMRKKLGITVIGSERSNPYYQYKNSFMKWLVNVMYSRLDGFVFQTEGAREYFNRKLRNKSAVIGNPLNVKELIGKERTPRRKEIVSVGRFTPEKNYPMLVNAFDKVHEKNRDAILKIYGCIDKTIGLEKLISSAGLEESIQLMGEVNNVQEEIRDAGMFVLSSKSEGLPNALMEAMALGLPVIATDCPSGGPRQLIRNGCNGLLVENDNSDALAEAIMTLINDEQLADKLGNEAKKVSVEYGIDNVCRQWSAYINKVYEENIL
jgi:glycosyltransferase involved in cell wall biosynthesis